MTHSIRLRGAACICVLAFYASYLLCCKLGAPLAGNPPPRNGDVAKKRNLTTAEDTHPCLEVPNGWLPNTPLPIFGEPPHHPEPDCPFYQAAWQTFLVATQPGSDGRSRFLSKEYSTLEDLFPSAVPPQFAKKRNGFLGLAPRTIQAPNDKSTVPHNTSGIGAGVNQAGFKGILIDQNGNPIYYAIHVNDVYKAFITAHGLTTKDALVNAPDDLRFPAGSIELKSAWQIVDENHPPANYFTTKAMVPKIEIQNGQLVVSKTSRPLTVALIALHVVFVLENHPEFVWSTFEHVSAGGQVRDNAPAAAKNPDDLDPESVVSPKGAPLYRAGTKAKDANSFHGSQVLASNFDEKTQAFKADMQTSVYRAFPASKSPASSPQLEEDGDIVDINSVMSQLFTGGGTSSDERGNYRLVGAVWLDDPENTFGLNKVFQNQDGQSSDEGMVAGEDRLSSTAMESFTQTDFPNCFSCHNTQRVTDDPASTVLLNPKLLNVSHVMSKFLADSK
jgi:hypothetical protein